MSALDAYVARIVAAAPPLTDEQSDRLRALFLEPGIAPLTVEFEPAALDELAEALA